MANCLICIADNVCTSCENGKYLKSDSTSCVNDCLVDDLGITW